MIIFYINVPFLKWLPVFFCRKKKKRDKDNKEVGCCLVGFDKIRPRRSEVTTNIRPQGHHMYTVCHVQKGRDIRGSSMAHNILFIQMDYFCRVATEDILLLTCRFTCVFVCHPHFSPGCLFSEVSHVRISLHILLGKQILWENNVAANTWLPLSIHSWLLAGPCAVVMVGDGWDLQFPLPGNVSCCETMWQKISTAVMAQQCSLPLYVLLQELIQSPPQMYCM